MSPQLPLVSLVLASLSGAAAGQATLHVPGTFPTIQQAIAAAVPGDTVLVAPGTYVETIDFLGKDISVLSSGNAFSTTIDGNQAGTVVTFHNGETAAALLDGFSITGGKGVNEEGGGVDCRDSSPSIRRCIIDQNAGARSAAGGVHAVGGSVSVRSCAFFLNRGGYGGVGPGGVGGPGAVEGVAELVDCLFESNYGGHVGDGVAGPGAALDVGDLTGCTFRFNHGGNAAAGSGGEGAAHGAGAFDDCSFESNIGGDVTDDGRSGTGGVRDADRLTDCTFFGNRAGACGGADHNEGGAGASENVGVIEGCRFTSNRGGSGGTGNDDQGGAGAVRRWNVLRDSLFDLNVGGDTLGHGIGGPGALACENGVLVEGCTFTGNEGGRPGPGADVAGGPGVLRSACASLEIAGCLFEGNRGGDAAPGGGIGHGGPGVFVLGGAPLVRDSEIRGNFGGHGVDDPDGEIAGAGVMYTEGNASEPTFLRCLIESNEGGRGEGGGGDWGGPGAFFADLGAQPRIYACILDGNKGGSAGTVGGVFDADERGGAGGYQTWRNAKGSLVGNTIVFNEGGLSAAGTAAAGGIMRHTKGSDVGEPPQALNTILWGNVAVGAEPEIQGIPTDGSVVPEPVTFCLVAGGFLGAGNIDGDPLFVDAPAGDFHVRCNSPCIDAGTAPPAGAADTDYYGGPRVDGPQTDIGADEFTLPVLGLPYCAALPNSTGLSADVATLGEDSVAANCLHLAAEPVPDSVGIFLAGTNQLQVAFGNGFRCVGGTTLRSPYVFAEAGRLSYRLDLAAPPAAGQVQPGTTWNFQAWYRDPMGGGSQFNLTDGRSVTFTP